MKKVVSLVLTCLLVISCSKSTFVKATEFQPVDSSEICTVSDVTDSDEDFGWSEGIIGNSKSLYQTYATGSWTLKSTKSYSTSLSLLTLKSYTLTYTNDTKLCKAIVTIKDAEDGVSNAYGYARARFTSAGIVIDGSDSGRRWKTGTATAVSPDAEDGGGWPFSSIARTYCGDETTADE